MYFPKLIAAVIALLVATSADARNKYDRFSGEAMAASLAHQRCAGVSRIGGDDVQQFVFRAADIAKAQNGLRVQKVRRILFYNQAAWLREQARLSLSERDVELANKAAFCSFAKKVAGKNDTIGRFLTK